MKGAWNILFVLVVASLVAGVIQLALIALIVLGLITRPAQTMGALLFLVMLNFIDRYPVMGLGFLSLIVLAKFMPDRRPSAGIENKHLLSPPEN